MIQFFSSARTYSVLWYVLGSMMLSSCNKQYDSLLVSDKTKAWHHAQYQTAYAQVETSSQVAERLATQALEQARSDKYTKGMADALFVLGVSNDIQGRYGKAVEYHLQSLWYRQTLDDQEGIMRSYHNLAFVHQFSNLHKESEEYYQKALDLAIKLKQKEEQAKINHNMGYLFRSTKKYEEAQRSYCESLTLYKELNLKKYIGYVYNDLGVVSELGHNPDYNKILTYYKKSLQINERGGFTDGVGWSLLNIGRMYTKLGKPKDALPYLEKAENILPKDYYNLSNIHIAKAEAYVALKNIETAKKSLVKAGSLEVHLQGVNKEPVLEAYQLAQRIYKDTSPALYNAYKEKEKALQAELARIKQAGRDQQRKSQQEVRHAESDFKDIVRAMHYWSFVPEEQ